MNRLFFTLVCLSLMASARVSKAALVLTLDDLNTAGMFADEIIVDNSAIGTPTAKGNSTALDSNPIPGVVGFGGNVGSFFVNPTTLGVSGVGPSIDLHLDILSLMGGSFQVMLTDTDFSLGAITPPVQLVSRIGGITSPTGSVTFQESFDAMNREFGATTTNGPVVLGPGAFNTSLTSGVTPAGLFSLTESIIVTLNGPGQVTIFDADSEVTGVIPEPMTSTIWACLGCFGLFAWRRRRRRS